MPLLERDSALQADSTHATSTAKKERLVSLDAVRGLTVVVMIFVDYIGDWMESVNHSPWNDMTLADFVMPFFLFMVGMSMSMSFRKYKAGLLQKVITRTAKLFLIGIATQAGAKFPAIGFLGFNLMTVRVPGILQRIAWAYFVVSLMAMYLPKLTAHVSR